MNVTSLFGISVVCEIKICICRCPFCKIMESNFRCFVDVRLAAVTPTWERSCWKSDQDRGDDYSGAGLPGVYFLQPVEDNFVMTVRRHGELRLDVTRVQFPLAPLAAGTYNNSQGKTVRGQGHTIDLQRPHYFLQHLYMILGRSTELAFSLYRNMSMCEATGEIDGSLFECGPPHFVSDILSRLEVGSFLFKTVTFFLFLLLQLVAVVVEQNFLLWQLVVILSGDGSYVRCDP